MATEELNLTITIQEQTTMTITASPSPISSTTATTSTTPVPTPVEAETAAAKKKEIIEDKVREKKYVTSSASPLESSPGSTLSSTPIPLSRSHDSPRVSAVTRPLGGYSKSTGAMLSLEKQSNGPSPSQSDADEDDSYYSVSDEIQEGDELYTSSPDSFSPAGSRVTGKLGLIPTSRVPGITQTESDGPTVLPEQDAFKRVLAKAYSQNLATISPSPSPTDKTNESGNDNEKTNNPTTSQPSSPRKGSSSGTQSPSDSSPNKSKASRRVRVLYDFSGRNEAQLSILKGDIITLLQKGDSQPIRKGWWLGEIRGKVGYFPAAYIEELGDGPITPPTSRPLKHRSSKDKSKRDKDKKKGNTVPNSDRKLRRHRREHSNTSSSSKHSSEASDSDFVAKEKEKEKKHQRSTSASGSGSKSTSDLMERSKEISTNATRDDKTIADSDSIQDLKKLIAVTSSAVASDVQKSNTDLPSLMKDLDTSSSHLGLFRTESGLIELESLRNAAADVSFSKETVLAGGNRGSGNLETVVQRVVAASQLASSEVVQPKTDKSSLPDPSPPSQKTRSSKRTPSNSSSIPLDEPVASLSSTPEITTSTRSTKPRKRSHSSEGKKKGSKERKDKEKEKEKEGGSRGSKVRQEKNQDKTRQRSISAELPKNDIITVTEQRAPLQRPVLLIPGVPTIPTPTQNGSVGLPDLVSPRRSTPTVIVHRRSLPPPTVDSPTVGLTPGTALSGGILPSASTPPSLSIPISQPPPLQTQSQPHTPVSSPLPSPQMTSNSVPSTPKTQALPPITSSSSMPPPAIASTKEKRRVQPRDTGSSISSSCSALPSVPSVKEETKQKKGSGGSGGPGESGTRSKKSLQKHELESLRSNLSHGNDLISEALASLDSGDRKAIPTEEVKHLLGKIKHSLSRVGSASSSDMRGEETNTSTSNSSSGPSSNSATLGNGGLSNGVPPADAVEAAARIVRLEAKLAKAKKKLKRYRSTSLKTSNSSSSSASSSDVILNAGVTPSSNSSVSPSTASIRGERLSSSVANKKMAHSHSKASRTKKGSRGSQSEISSSPDSSPSSSTSSSTVVVSKASDGSLNTLDNQRSLEELNRLLLT